MDRWTRHSEKYFVSHRTLARRGPGIGEASLFSLREDDEVRAAGQAYGQGAPTGDGDRETKTWLKVTTTNGAEGFVTLQDVLTPEQFAERKKLQHHRDLLDPLFERLDNATGPLANISGIYALQVCPDKILNVGVQILPRWLRWTENNTFIRASAANPEVVITYDITADKTGSFRDGGEEWGNGKKLQFYKLTPTLGQDPKLTTEFMAFNGDYAYYRRSGDSYGLYRKCGTLSAERYKITHDFYPYMIEQWPKVLKPTKE